MLWSCAVFLVLFLGDDPGLSQVLGVVCGCVCVTEVFVVGCRGVCFWSSVWGGVGVILGLGCVCYQACVRVLHVTLLSRDSDAASQRGVPKAGKGVQKNLKTGKPNQFRSNRAFWTSSMV